MLNNTRICWLLASLGVIFACQSPKKPIPVYGKPIPAFSFLNQDSIPTTEKPLGGHITVVDFFFTSCPTICPQMQREMLRVHDAFKADTLVHFMSFSIDPEYDTVGVLREYAARMGVAAPKWQFLTGDKEAIFALGNQHFMVSAAEDPNAPGGHVHSGALILVDAQRRIRGYFDGTKAAEVDKLIAAIAQLQTEK